ncbi:molecular chaperone DnaJ [Candidatus Competibacter phosphatis]|uniref:Molecular chaperone DnaJ n=1 Tax=Candidatus Competibacter phosphatis TaxID=221280 RepID=A0ABX1TGT9_9GAMM|nr:DnaJ domain-containing protein [Candidatus Competibacter phosphatis]NMQ18593.1 molecular chaperone DnaJ [Candidatus Competibacter phosphatis]
MLIRVLLVAAVLIGLYLLVRKLRRSGSIARLPRLLAAAGIAGFLMLLTVRGGAEIAVPLLAVLAPLLLRWLQLPSPSSTTTGQASPNQSAVTTRFLDMTLDHASGVMSGTVREGRFAGRSLQDLTLPELLELWRECQSDPQSTAVLEAYLDRHADASWRDQADIGRKDRTQATENNRMDRAEAYRVLGLQPSAGRDEIQAAYRRLIQRVHPDQGGSSDLAARINQARDVLLRR